MIVYDVPVQEMARAGEVSLVSDPNSLIAWPGHWLPQAQGCYPASSRRGAG